MARLLIIGDGIAGEAVIFSLMQRAILDKFSSIIQVAAEDLAPATSLRSTAVAALRGTQKGFSPLGDELYEAFEYAQEIYTRHEFPGTEKVFHQTWIYQEQKQKRFAHLPLVDAKDAKQKPLLAVEEVAWVIEPHRFLQHLQSLSAIERRKAFVNRLEKNNTTWIVHLLGGERLEAEHVIMASGHGMTWMKEWLTGTPLEGMYPVQGSYLEWNKIDLKQASFSYSFDGINLIYQSANQRLLLGATSFKVDHLVADVAQLREMKAQVEQYLTIELPAFHQAQMKTALRSQTRARRPYAGELQTGLWAIGGLYKNGWVSAWKLADDLVKKLCATL